MRVVPTTVMRDGSEGDRLAAVMRAKGVSQAELARRTGLSARTVREIVHGRRDGNVATWAAIARALGCGIDDVRDR